MTLSNAGLFGLLFTLSTFSLPPHAHATTFPLTPPQPIENDLPIQKVFVLGKDSRTQYIPRRYRDLASSIGILYKTNSKGICTAFCVAPDVIATAAHCAMSGKKRQRKPDFKRVYFLRYNYSRKSFTAPAQASVGSDILARNVIAGVSTSRKYKSNLRTKKHDWALIKLRSPVCTGHVLQVHQMTKRQAYEAATNYGEIFQIAFHSDKFKMRKPTYSDPCNFYKISKRAKRVPQSLKHSCDMTKGSSGSPIFMDLAGGPVVVGINTAGFFNQKVRRRGKKIIKRYRAIPRYNLAVNASVFVKKIAPLSNLKIIFQKDALIRLQKSLKQRNFYNSKIDGVYGPSLHRGIKALQRKVGLHVDGLPSYEMQRLLLQNEGKELNVATGKPYRLNDVKKKSVSKANDPLELMGGKQLKPTPRKSAEFRRRARALARRQREYQESVGPETKQYPDTEFGRRAAALARRQKQYQDSLE